MCVANGQPVADGYCDESSAKRHFGKSGRGLCSRIFPCTQLSSRDDKMFINCSQTRDGEYAAVGLGCSAGFVAFRCVKKARECAKSVENLWVFFLVFFYGSLYLFYIYFDLNLEVNHLSRGFFCICFDVVWWCIFSDYPSEDFPNRNPLLIVITIIFRSIKMSAQSFCIFYVSR